jgi:hypothetical protein
MFFLISMLFAPQHISDMGRVTTLEVTGKLLLPVQTSRQDFWLRTSIHRLHTLFPTGVEEQTRLAWCNLAFQLEAAGMTFDTLVKVTMYFPDRDDIPASRPARAEALGSRRTASTVLVAALAPFVED